MTIQCIRCISWDILSTMPEVITGGGPLDVVGAGPTNLYKLSQACQLSECDAFLSHSWNDNGRQKWQTLRGWCEEFKGINHRSPRLWIDKFCIEQNNIQADLRRLPIFLAGCNIILILSGPTYTSRLWCCVELFVEVTMRGNDESRELPILLTLGDDENEHERVRESWDKFDAAACQCFNAEDKTRMFAVIERHPGGIQGFNAGVKDMVAGIGRKSPILRLHGASASSASACVTAEQGPGLTNVIPGSVPS